MITLRSIKPERLSRSLLVKNYEWPVERLGDQASFVLTTTHPGVEIVGKLFTLESVIFCLN